MVKITIRFFILFALLVSSVEAKDLTTFITSTNQYSNQLLFYRPYTHSAMIKENFSTTVAVEQSNIFQRSENLDADFGLTTLDILLEYPINERVSLSLEYPLYYFSEGFLDGFLDGVHKTLGIATTREHDGHKSGEFHYNFAGEIVEEKSFYASGNPQLEVAYLLYKSDTLFLSTRVGLKLPFAKKEYGLSSDGVDIMASFALQKNFRTFAVLLNTVVTKNAPYKLEESIIAKEYRYFFSVATQFPLRSLVEYPLLKGWDFIALYSYNTSPYSATDVKYDSPSNFMQFALRKELLKSKYIDLFFNQNTIPRHNEADVTFGIAYHF